MHCCRQAHVGSLLKAGPLTHRHVLDSQKVKSAAKSVQKKAGMSASKAEPKQAKQAKSGGLLSNVAQTVRTCCRPNTLAISKCCGVATSFLVVPQGLRVQPGRSFMPPPWHRHCTQSCLLNLGALTSDHVVVIGRGPFSDAGEEGCPKAPRKARPEGGALTSPSNTS